METAIDPNRGWIEGKLGPIPEGISGPLIFGSNWLLEMLRFDDSGHCLGFFWAPFAIVHQLPILDGSKSGDFVGFTGIGKPPADWLTTSMIFALDATSLARTPKELLAIVETPHPYTAIEAGAGASPLSRRAKAQIVRTYGGSTSVSEIAGKLGVSHAHLSRQFKRDFGLTPVDYRNRLRVNDAMGRLSQGEKILDVGYEVGFNDTSRFYEDFRKVTGTSPGKCKTGQ